MGQCNNDTALSYSVPVTNVSAEPWATTRLALSILFEQLDGDLPAGGKHHLVEPHPVTRRASTRQFPTT